MQSALPISQHLHKSAFSSSQLHTKEEMTQRECGLAPGHLSYRMWTLAWGVSLVLLSLLLKPGLGRVETGETNDRKIDLMSHTSQSSHKPRRETCLSESLGEEASRNFHSLGAATVCLTDPVLAFPILLSPGNKQQAGT